MFAIKMKMLIERLYESCGYKTIEDRSISYVFSLKSTEDRIRNTLRGRVSVRMNLAIERCTSQPFFKIITQ